MAGTISRGRGGVSRALNLCTLMTLLSCASIVAACDHDAPTGLTAVETPPSRVVEIASPANSAYDNGINRNDTWMEQTQTIAETTTVTSSEPFDDPNTGQQTYTTTLGSEPQTVNVSAGYGYDGQPRFTTGFQQTSGEETIWMQRVTDVTTDRRADGSDTQPIAYDPMNELGSLYGARLEYGSGAGSGGGGSGCTQITGCAALRTGAAAKEWGLIRPFGTSGPAFAASGHSIATAVSVLTQDRIRIAETVASGMASTGGLMAYPAMNQASAFAASDAKTQHKLTRDYEKQDDGEWALKHMMDEAFVETTNTRVRFALHLTVVKARRNRNKEKDAARVGAAQQTADSVIPMTAPANHVTGDQCDATTAIITCSNSPTPGFLPEPLHVDPMTIATQSYWRAGASAGPPVVLQHGFLSSAATWKRMDYWLSRDLPDASVLRPTLPWRATYENQAGALHDTIAANIGSRAAILIGHSNGGMVSRYLGRHPAAWGGYPTANVSAVITIGSPHYGAPLAKTARSVNRLFAFGGLTAFLMCSWSNTAGCSSWAHVSTSKVPSFTSAFTTGVPVLGEMQASDQYHQNFNGEYEGFRRYGVSSLIWSRWMPWRLYGDMQCLPESGCGGAAEVRRIDRIYKRDISCIVIGALLGRIDSIFRCSADLLFLRGVDEFYRRLVGMGGDGLVPDWSQRYPFIPTQDRYVVAGKNAPSHLGETQSPNVGNRIELILVSRLGLRGTVALPQ